MILFWSADHDHFYSENEATFGRLISMPKGISLSEKGEKKLVLKRWNRAIQVFSYSDQQDSANYYKQGLQELIMVPENSTE